MTDPTRALTADQAVLEAQERVIAENPEAVVAANQELAASLRKEYGAILQDEKRLKERKDVLRDLMLAMIDEGGEDKRELVVGGQIVARRTIEKRTYLDTTEVKRRYPQNRYPAFYTETETEVLRMVEPKEAKPKGRRRG